MKSLYLLINFFTVVVPFLFSFHPKLNFYKHWKSFFLANSITAFLFISWDILFTHLGVWGFNPNYVLGLYIFNLPIEEILFFICIPYACVFTYHCLNLFYNLRWKPLTETVFVLTSCLSLLLIGLFFFTKLYTASIFISLAIMLLLLKYVAKINWLPRLVLIYPILLIPFFIVNGILTGSGIDAPIVWYNNQYNLFIRLLTIPVEDIFYGFELILLNLFFYEFFNAKWSVNK